MRQQDLSRVCEMRVHEKPAIHLSRMNFKGPCGGKARSISIIHPEINVLESIYSKNSKQIASGICIMSTAAVQICFQFPLFGIGRPLRYFISCLRNIEHSDLFIYRHAGHPFAVRNDSNAWWGCVFCLKGTYSAPTALRRSNISV